MWKCAISHRTYFSFIFNFHWWCCQFPELFCDEQQQQQHFVLSEQKSRTSLCRSVTKQPSNQRINHPTDRTADWRSGRERRMNMIHIYILWANGKYIQHLDITNFMRLKTNRFECYENWYKLASISTFYHLHHHHHHQNKLMI